jgi:hypothetical protein
MAEDSGAGWTGDQWNNYFFEAATTDTANFPSGLISMAVGPNDDADANTVQGSNAQQQPWKSSKIFESGQAYTIYRVLYAFDMPGMGQCDVLSDKTTNPTPVDLNQLTEGCYVWGNTLNGGTAGQSGKPGVVEDLHYYNEDGSYDGTSGIGMGAIGSRPASPALLGTAWWDTGDNELTRWNGSTWEARWSEYTFPHPLTAGGLADEDPPTPDPMTFAVAPAAAGPSSVTMTATTASDASSPIQYQVRIDGATETAWQGATSFTVSGLSPATEYDFEVRARDSASTPNMTAYSSISSATTDTVGAAPQVTATTVSAGTISITQ